MHACWQRESVLRMLGDLIDAELRRLRPGGPPAVSGPVDRVLDSLQLDSLEVLDIATAVAVQFHLHETGMEAELLEHVQLDAWASVIVESRRCWDKALSFQTSGSTGSPRLCRHAMGRLEHEVSWFSSQLADRQRVLTAVPAHHIYGFLFGVMLPAGLGVPVQDVRGRLPASVLRDARDGDLLIGHPAFYQLAVRAQPSLSGSVTLLSATAPCSDTLWQQLEQAGCARLIEIYGSSETAGIGTRESASAPFTLLPQWIRDPVRSDCLQPAPVNSDAMIFDGRLDHSLADAQLSPPDALEWLDARHFRVLARRDLAVQIGGNNVYPARVQQVLCDHPEVAEAAVRLASEAQGGRLKAFVVPVAQHAEPQALAHRLHAWIAERLSPLERPRSLRIGDALPRSPEGKLTDWPMEEG